MFFDSIIQNGGLLAALNAVEIGGAGLVLLGVGVAFAVVLNIAHGRLKVERDPVVEAIEAALPGANCGGCGFPGCSAYAEALAEDHKLLGKCGPGGDPLMKQLAAVLGIEAGATAPVRPVVHCAAHQADRMGGGRYAGIKGCSEAQTIAGAMGCPYGCLGFGDCVRACDFDAIDMVDGLARVDYHKCVGCGACVQACPRQIIELVPFTEEAMLTVACSSVDKAKEVRSYCKVGCVGCGLCAKLEPTTFQMRQNLAAIDYEQYGRWAASEKAIKKCPRAAMVLVGQGGVRLAREALEEAQATPGATISQQDAAPA